ncbi:glycosyltransferase family 4 protein [Acetobacterium sp.]|uniref:glycosyltransferase family 4 protein n=1 Tax=Acetobacterium sp. TaxID=1872094 RepID=UPI0035942412
MIKILMCGNHPTNKGGMTSVINQICEYDWKQDDIQLSFIPTFKPGNSAVKILFFCCSYFKLISKMICDRPDIVHVHMSYKGSFTRAFSIHLLCKLLGVKDVIHLHGSEFEKWYDSSSELKQKKIRKLLRECSQFIVLGDKWKKVISRIESTTKIYVISNGIKIPEKTVQWRVDCCKILYLGVLIPRKGLSDLLNAIKRLKDTGSISNMHFIIAGTGSDEKKLKTEVEKMHLNDKVEFVGWVSGDKKTYYLEHCQVMVSPSYNEGLPISILEAASYGMPIVATDVGDIASVVLDNISGFLIRPGDIEALTDALGKVSMKENYKNMSINARCIAVDKFSIDIFLKKLFEVYRNVYLSK